MSILVGTFSIFPLVNNLKTTAEGNPNATIPRFSILLPSVGVFASKTYKILPDPKIPKILKKIAKCESRDRQFQKDGSVVRGDANPRDIGRYQINLDYHEKKAREMGLDLFKEEDNEKYALYLFEKEGTRPWNWSKKCWQLSTIDTS